MEDWLRETATTKKNHNILVFIGKHVNKQVSLLSSTKMLNYLCTGEDGINGVRCSESATFLATSP